MFKLVNQCNKPLNRDLFITVAGNQLVLVNQLTKLVAERLGFRAHYEKRTVVTHIRRLFIGSREKWETIYNYTS